MFVLTGPVLLELMMSDFSPVPFVFINIISRGEGGHDALFCLLQSKLWPSMEGLRV